MNSVSKILLRLANWKMFSVLFLLFLSFNLYFFPKAFQEMPSDRVNTIPVIDLQFGYNPARVKSIVAMYTGKAKEGYLQSTKTTDTIYPIIYFLLLSSLISIVFYKWKITTRFQWLNLLPLSIVFFDYNENYLIVKMLNTYPADIDIMAAFCSFFTLSKWVAMCICLLILSVGVAENLRKRVNL